MGKLLFYYDLCHRNELNDAIVAIDGFLSAIKNLKNV